MVPVDEKHPFGIRTLRKALLRGESVMIFPEGMISLDGQRNPLQPGGMAGNTQTHAPIAWLQITGAEQSRVFAKIGPRTMAPHRFGSLMNTQPWLLQVGKPYSEQRTQWTQGFEFRYFNGHHQLQICVKSPTQKELDAFDRNPIHLGLYIEKKMSCSFCSR
ncbi:hypothetical protein ACFQAT_27940 [Undibacterium arcticum]|uniref:hypothetical protein n=1 Tax=Undibacterium arcticum TaxID=1762892 RepID=UPI00362064ED